MTNGALFSPRDYVNAALFIGSDLDLSNASAVELELLMTEAIAAGFSLGGAS